MSIASNLEKSQQAVPVTHYDVVVIGAGPYGLSTAAHLKAKGLKVAIFGKTLELWREHMPKGMFLRSHWWASNLSDPHKKYTFERFFKASKYDKCYPVSSEAFIEYALWFQKHAVPEVDETYVALVEREGSSFLLTLEDGRVLRSTAVVMAIGLYYYANRPDEYNDMPAELVSHSFDYADYSCFAGKQIALIGGGQSAVEYAALIHESGASSVHLITRRPIHWLDRDRADERTLLEQIKAPNSGIAPGWKNWVLEYMPYVFYRFPQARKDRYIRNNYNAAASEWLRDRVIGKAALHEGKKVEAIQPADNKVTLTLSDGEQLTVDHVMLATGYKVNLAKLPMLHTSLLNGIHVDMGIPILSPWFESSVPGLYFVGLTSLRCFGPLYRFVVGAKSSAQRVAGAVSRRAVRSR